jgi:hypothetical protein
MPRVCGVSGTTLTGEEVSVMSASKRMFHVDRTAASATHCGSKPVSGRGLRKTGIFPNLPRDFRRFRRESGQIRSLETDNQFAKARYWRAFLRLLGVVSLSVGLVGWGGSSHIERNYVLNSIIFADMRNGYTDKNTVNFSHWNTHRTRRCLASSCSGVTEESTRDFILIFFSGAKLVRQANIGISKGTSVF